MVLLRVCILVGRRYEAPKFVSYTKKPKPEIDIIVYSLNISLVMLQVVYVLMKHFVN